MNPRTQMSILQEQLRLKSEFPLLRQYPDLHYLDNASTTQMPDVVLTSQTNFYVTSHANPHRTLYDLGVAATNQYEAARHTVARFLRAPSEGVVVTANATAALNMAAAIEAQRLQAGDEIILSVAEHHSNMLPWRRAAHATGATIVWLKKVGAHHIDMEELRSKLNARTKVVAVAHISNVLGSIAPLADIVSLAHGVGARVVIDAAQSAARLPLDVAELAADYVALSAHKMYGPTGAGVLFAQPEYLKSAAPFMVGGGTVAHVSREETVWHDALPQRWEAGTPNTAGAIGMAAAVQYLLDKGLGRLWWHEQEVTHYALERLQRLPYVRLVGPSRAQDRAGIFSFTVEVGGQRLHSHDVVSVANEYHVALRGGHHCAEPLMQALGVSDLVRASVAAYSSKEDIDALSAVLATVHSIFSRTPS